MQTPVFSGHAGDLINTGNLCDRASTMLTDKQFRNLSKRKAASSETKYLIHIGMRLSRSPLVRMPPSASRRHAGLRRDPVKGARLLLDVGGKPGHEPPDPVASAPAEAPKLLPQWVERDPESQ